MFKSVITPSTQSNAHQPIGLWPMTVDIECNSIVRAAGGRRTKVSRAPVATPIVALFVTSGVSRHEETTVERGVADQQLVFAAGVRHTVGIEHPVVLGFVSVVGRNEQSTFRVAFEEGGLFGLLIHIQDICELKKTTI